MKLYHVKCKYPVTVVTDRLSVRILDFNLTEEGTLEPSLLDIFPERSGKIHCTCMKCREEEIPQNELGLTCIKCGTPVPITEMLSLKPDWYVLCPSCIELLLSKMYSDPDERPKIEPIKLKIK